MNSRFCCCICLLSAPLLFAQSVVDLTNPSNRQMVLNERRTLNCAGIYRQTRSKFEAQLKLAGKLELSGGLSPQTVASLTEATTALGQKRFEFCELYKVTPEMTKDDYFRVYGELTKKESDLSLLFRYLTGKGDKADLRSLQTMAVKETGGKLDVHATLGEMLRTIDSVSVRVNRAESRLTRLEEENIAKQEGQEDAERLKRTAPKLTAELAPASKKGTVRLVIVCENGIPFEFRHFVTTKDSRVVSGFMMAMAKVVPQPGERQFLDDIEIQTENVADSYLELHFFWKSLYAEELRLADHAGEIVRRYRVAPDYAILTPLP